MSNRARVVTLNTWGVHPPVDERLAVTAAQLAALHPDVVLLQEVRVGEGIANTADRLAAHLGSQWRAVYACATRGPAGTWGPGTGAGEEGLAILSRHAIGDTREVELPEVRPTSRRLLLSARVDLGGAPLWCHTTHLHWRPEDGVAREKQVVAIDDAVGALGGDDVHVLGGDFNAPHDADEIRFLRGKHTLCGRRAYWVDAFERIHGTAPGHTWSSRNPGVGEIRTLEPDRRIDFLFVSPRKRDGRGQVFDARVVLDQPDAGGVFASDHFGVMADLGVG